MSTDSLLVHALVYGIVPAWLPLLAMLFLQVNAAIMLLMLTGLVLHSIAAALDIRSADATRGIPPTEQNVHSALGALPVAATFIVVVLRWREFRVLRTLRSRRGISPFKASVARMD